MDSQAGPDEASQSPTTDEADPVEAAVSTRWPGQASFTPVQIEIADLLPQSKGNLGEVSRLLSQGIVDRRTIVDSGAAANSGAVGNILSDIRAIRDGQIPTAPSLASLALSATRSFRKQHRERLSPAAEQHIEAVVDELEAAVNDKGAQDKEEEQLKKKGDLLEEKLVAEGGVYVFTYPHYWRYPTVEGTRRTLLKVGMTAKDAGLRVRQQARQTGQPEDPLLLRVYQSEEIEPRALEKVFHRLLRAADHVREEGATAGGKEWFETSTEFLDTIAATLDLAIEEVGNDDEDLG